MSLEFPNAPIVPARVSTDADPVAASRGATEEAGRSSPHSGPQGTSPASAAGRAREGVAPSWGPTGPRLWATPSTPERPTEEGRRATLHAEWGVLLEWGPRLRLIAFCSVAVQQPK